MLRPNQIIHLDIAEEMVLKAVAFNSRRGGSSLAMIRIYVEESGVDLGRVELQHAVDQLKRKVLISGESYNSTIKITRNGRALRDSLRD
jgi:hypothetical protein